MTDDLQSVKSRGPVKQKGPAQKGPLLVGERIRTTGPCLPKTVLYQAELLPGGVGRAYI